jgi:hypothetical protein
VTILLARVKHAARWAWAGLFAVLGIVGAFILYTLSRRRSMDAGTAIDQHLEVARHARELAGARMAVEIAAARKVAGKERDELLAALAEEDPDRQAERLIELARRERGE